MAKLIYLMITSLDGYIADEEGNFDWSVPDDEVHAFVNDCVRPVGTYLYGRRMYEIMSAWETLPTDDEPDAMRDFAAIWKAADKIVYSSTLETISSARTRIERTFDPETIRQLKSSADRDLAIAGPDLSAHAFRAGLIDECHFFVNPIIVGGGNSAFPVSVRLPLELLSSRRFANGVTYLHYRANN